MAADGLFPPGGALGPSGSEAGVVDYFDDMLAELLPKQRTLIRLLLVFIELVPMLVFLRLPLSRQSQEQREDTLARLGDSPIYVLRMTFQSLRTLIGIGYLASPEIAEATGAQPNLDPYGVAS